MSYTSTARWKLMRESLQWVGDPMDLRSVVLYTIYKMPKEADLVREALIRYYFRGGDKIKDDPKDSRFHQFLKEGRLLIKSVMTYVDLESPEFKQFKYRNEHEIIAEILGETVNV